MRAAVGFHPAAAVGFTPAAAVGFTSAAAIAGQVTAASADTVAGVHQHQIGWMVRKEERAVRRGVDCPQMRADMRRVLILFSASHAQSSCSSMH